MANSDDVFLWSGVSLSTVFSLSYLLVYVVFQGLSNETHAANTSAFFDSRFTYFSSNELIALRDEAKQMFDFGYSNYMHHAYPKDELDPIHCTGRGPDKEDRNNININDVLGDYMLTLIDSLDTLVVMGNLSEFRNAVKLVIDNLSFDKHSQVQVFEANIRVLGGLLSAHLLLIDDLDTFGEIGLDNYNNELLSLANDLASRLLPAFSGTRTGIPFPRVNLTSGTDPEFCLHCVNETCSAGAATLLLEFGLLSALVGDPVYYQSASRAVQALYAHRSKDTGLLGNVIDIQTGLWVGQMSGVGAGLDSVYEYLIKSAILFGDQAQIDMFDELYSNIRYFLRKGRESCVASEGKHPVYVNVNMADGNVINNWVDALSAAWPGIQLLHGDVDEAICGHLLYYSIWRKYDALPERWNWHTLMPELSFYPLRPELVETTYLLYRATRSPFYQHVGKRIMQSIQQHARVECGYATIHDVTDKSLEDRMESFFLSETCKYLYLLFDEENPVHQSSSTYLFSTEGHLYPVRREYREAIASLLNFPPETLFNTNTSHYCPRIKSAGNIPVPLKHILQLEKALGVSLG